MYLLHRLAAFVIRQKVERQKTRSSIERPFRCLMDEALLQSYLRSERAQGLLSQLQHLT